MEQSVTPAPRSFEDALARLEVIEATLERSDVPLADAINLCVEAAALKRFCQAQLAEAEGKLEQLVETNGQVRLEPMEQE